MKKQDYDEVEDAINDLLDNEKKEEKVEVPPDSKNEKGEYEEEETACSEMGESD